MIFLSLSGSVVSWSDPSYVTFDVSAVFLNGSGVYIANVNGTLDLSSISDLTRRIDITVLKFDADSNMGGTLGPITYYPAILPFDVSFQSTQSVDGSILLSWQPHVQPSSYTLTDDHNNSFTVNVIDTSASLAVADVSFGTTYNFVLTANYATLEYSGSIINYVSQFAGPIAPPAFTMNMTAAKISSSSVKLSWQRPATVPNSYSLTSNHTFTVGSIQTMDTSTTITGLTAGVAYSFTLAAVYSGIQYSGSITTLASITIVPDESGGGSGANCFLENASVLTPLGYRKISTMVVGDMVITGDGRPAKVQRVIKMHIDAGPSVNPYIIPKGLYGAMKRLLISPLHCVSTEKGMVEARHLGLEQENMNGSFDYYNLELPSWGEDTMVVDGVKVESMAPVRRMKMTMQQFTAKLTRQYGEITPEIMANVRRTCRTLIDGCIEVPVFINNQTKI